MSVFGPQCTLSCASSVRHTQAPSEDSFRFHLFFSSFTTLYTNYTYKLYSALQSIPCLIIFLQSLPSSQASLPFHFSMKQMSTCKNWYIVLNKQFMIVSMKPSIHLSKLLSLHISIWKSPQVHSCTGWETLEFQNCWKQMSAFRGRKICSYI